MFVHLLVNIALGCCLATCKSVANREVWVIIGWADEMGHGPTKEVHYINWGVHVTTIHLCMVCTTLHF